MTANYSKYDMFAAYRNPANIGNQMQNKISNINENELIFPQVDYSSAYNDIIEKYSDLFDGSNDGNTTGDGSSGDTGSESGTVENNNGTTGTIATEEQIKQLRETYEQIKDEQGWLGNAWNGIKNFFGHSNGSDAVEKALEQAENGEITYEEAVEKLNTYASKQDSFVNTFANVASGLAVAVGAVLSPFSFGATLAIGTAAGAAIKVGIKASDKATNNVDGDYTLKDVAKDGITGAVSSAVTVATAGIGSAGINLAKEGGKVAVKEVVKEGAIAGAKAGAIDGGVMSATNYIADAAFDGDEFSLGGLAKSTVTGTVAGAATGGVVGGIASGLTAIKVNKSASATEVADELIDQATDEASEQAVKNATQEAAQEATDEASEQAVKNAAQEELLTGNQKKKVYNSNGREAKTQAQRNSVLKNKVQNKEIVNLQDAYKAGFTDSEVRASGLYNKLAHASGATQEAANEASEQAVKNATQEATQEATDEAGEQAAKQAANVNGVDNSSNGIIARIKKSDAYNAFSERVKNLASNARSLTNKTPSEIKDALVGKAGATKQEFIDAYKMLQDTDEYKTNLLFRSLLDDAYDVINS